MVAGLIAVAVANEVVIAHPQGHTSLALSLLLSGGSIFSSWLPKALSVGSAERSIASALGRLATLVVPAYVALILAGASLATLPILAR